MTFGSVERHGAKHGVVTFTLAVNLSRGQPIASVAAALLIAAGLHRLWARAGRPRGIAETITGAEHNETE